MSAILPAPGLTAPAGGFAARDAAQAGAASLGVAHVSHGYAGRAVLDEVSWHAQAGELLCLLGHSGCGKTTLLRLIAGLETPRSGRVLIGDDEMSGPSRFIAPEQRGVGLVFQDYALFPHLSVLANIAFGLRGLPRERARATALELLERIGLSSRAHSYPHTLSGGEQQRVALARALAPAPRVLLMDEPFSNLDRRTRDHVRDETLALLRDASTTAVVVTHDPEEAMRIADRIVLLRDGRVEQIGEPRAIWDQPASLFAARFFGDWNELAAICVDGGVETPFGRFPAAGIQSGSRATVCIRAHELQIADRGVPVTVTRRTFLGEHEQLQVVGAALSAPLNVLVSARFGVQVGQTLHLRVDPSAVRVFANVQAVDFAADRLPASSASRNPDP